MLLPWSLDIIDDDRWTKHENLVLFVYKNVSGSHDYVYRTIGSVCEACY